MKKILTFLSLFFTSTISAEAYRDTAISGDLLMQGTISVSCPDIHYNNSTLKGKIEQKPYSYQCTYQGGDVILCGQISGDKINKFVSNAPLKFAPVEGKLFGTFQIENKFALEVYKCD